MDDKQEMQCVLTTCAVVSMAGVDPHQSTVEPAAKADHALVAALPALPVGRRPGKFHITQLHLFVSTFRFPFLGRLSGCISPMEFYEYGCPDCGQDRSPCNR